MQPKTLDKKTVHKYIGFEKFGGPLYKSFQGQLVCCPLPPPNGRVLLAITA